MQHRHDLNGSAIQKIQYRAGIDRLLTDRTRRVASIGLLALVVFVLFAYQSIVAQQSTKLPNAARLAIHEPDRLLSPTLATPNPTATNHQTAPATPHSANARCPLHSGIVFQNQAYCFSFQGSLSFGPGNSTVTKEQITLYLRVDKASTSQDADRAYVKINVQPQPGSEMPPPKESGAACVGQSDPTITIQQSQPITLAGHRAWRRDYTCNKNQQIVKELLINAEPSVAYRATFEPSSGADAGQVDALFTAFMHSFTLLTPAEPTTIGTAGPVATASPTMTPTRLSTTVPQHPVLFPTPTSALLPVLPAVTLPLTVTLPASFYYLGLDGQIRRLVGAAPHYTDQALTQEACPITDFAVSPIHGRLAYVTNNQLIEFDPASGERVVKIKGQPLRPHVNSRIMAPHYSPDGTQIAYVYDGVNLLKSGMKELAAPQRLLRNVLFINGQPAAQLDQAVGDWSADVEKLRFYKDLIWSPDGAKLMVAASQWEGGLNAIYAFSTSTAVDVLASGGRPPGFSAGGDMWSWGRDSKTAYSSITAFDHAALYQIDAQSGVAHQLDITSMFPADRQAGYTRHARAMHPQASGALRFLISSQSLSHFYTIATMNLLDGSVHLVNPAFQIELDDNTEALWATDDSGLIIRTDILPGASDLFRLVGALYWLDKDGTTLVKLGVRGDHLRWGPPDVHRSTEITQ